MANGDEVETARIPRVSFVIANTMKLAGLVVFVREAVTTKDTIVMGICAFMMAGVQALESIVTTFLERFFGAPNLREPR